MRRDQLEIGLEREYALYASTGGTVAYLLAVDRLLALFHARADARWREMHATGWRIAPEYSHCLVEIASPPYPRGGWSELLAGFAYLEAALARAAEELSAKSAFDRVTCTADYSVRTDRFVRWDGARVTTFADLLLDGAHANWLLGSPDDVPPCFVGSAPELLYAGFTSTNVTVHPPQSDRGDLADYFWHVLYAARQIDIASAPGHPLLREGRLPVPPDPDKSIRDALIRWGDPATAVLLETLTPGDGAARFQTLFGQPPSPAFSALGFHAYSCRPRVLDDIMLFELRCLHSGIPLAQLAPLLDAAAAFPR